MLLREIDAEYNINVASGILALDQDCVVLETALNRTKRKQCHKDDGRQKGDNV